MSKRGLYPTLSKKDTYDKVKLMMDFISVCDGKNSLLNIADLLNVPIWELYELANKLESYNIISARE